MRWIKVRADVVDDLAVMGIAERMGLDTPGVLGRLVLVWLWADAQTVDGVLAGATCAMVDRVAQREGFARAMVEVGWLRERSGDEGGGSRSPTSSATTGAAPRHGPSPSCDSRSTRRVRRLESLTVDRQQRREEERREKSTAAPPARLERGRRAVRRRLQARHQLRRTMQP